MTLKPFLEFLRDRFRSKIDPEEYYLSYSGGKDSHFLLWFIREYLDEQRIPIVGVNTGFEIPEIRDRILRNSDVVLKPAMSRWQIKSDYGIPCFSKQQDEYIHRYQNGSRSDNTMRAIMGQNTLFNLNNRARNLLLTGQLHKVSNKCCYYNKELPMIRYGKETGKKAIIGTRQGESATRKAKYTKCLTAKGNFTPLYDFSDELMDGLYKEFRIEIPQCYQYLGRTGCAGCPYGRSVETEIAMLPRLQRMNTIKYFHESYDALGIDYSNVQMVFGYTEETQ